MKISKRIQKVKFNNELIVGFDIDQKTIDLYCEYGEVIVHCIEDVFFNQTAIIEQKLTELLCLAEKTGFSNIHVVCEPTGGYEKKLIHTAKRLKCSVSYVNPESVKKFEVVESNDDGKYDKKDARVIFLLAKNNKILQIRSLSGEYLLLRQMDAIYDSDSKMLSALKSQLHFALVNLFPDFPFNNEFLYDKTGRAFMKRFNGNPYTIQKMGSIRFQKAMKHLVPRVRKKTLEKFWESAVASTSNVMDPEYIMLLQYRVSQLWKDILHLEKRREQLRKKTISLYRRLQEKEQAVLSPIKGVINEFNLARLIGVTGPIHDFPHWRMLLRYLGLNIRKKESGKYKGKDRTSKKGRSLGRCIMSQIIYPLIRKKALYGPYYHNKKAKGMPGQKAQVAVMRKVLRLIFALSKKQAVFDARRVFVCHSSSAKAA